MQYFIQIIRDDSENLFQLENATIEYLNAGATWIGMASGIVLINVHYSPENIDTLKKKDKTKICCDLF